MQIFFNKIELLKKFKPVSDESHVLGKLSCCYCVEWTRRKRFIAGSSIKRVQKCVCGDNGQRRVLGLVWDCTCQELGAVTLRAIAEEKFTAFSDVSI